MSLDKQDHDPIVSSKVLMYGNVRNKVHITVRGVHKLKLGSLLFSKSSLNSRTTLFTRSGKGKALIFPSKVESVSKT